MRIETRLNRSWYEGETPPWWAVLLSPVFHFVVFLRRKLFRWGVFKSQRMPVPVIVVGNITAGGTGKSPLTVALVEALRARGVRCGIVSRGYGGRAGKQPIMVSTSSDVARVGDESLMIARRTHAPVCVHPRRARAARTLLANAAVDVIICDDGLQHYALARDIEIAVVDGRRGLGNQRMLPAGPLREPPARLASVDHVVINGEGGISLPNAWRMRLEPTALVNLASGERLAPDALAGQPCVAVAGIGNPQRFFSTLALLDYSPECHVFPDHHRFSAEDLAGAGDRPLVMTEKDAVKCGAFARASWWYLEVSAKLDAAFLDAFTRQVGEKVRKRSSDNDQLDIT